MNSDSIFKHRRLLAAIISAFVLAVLGFSADSYAGSSTGNLTVNATVLSTCSIATTSVAFGTYSPVAIPNLTGNGSVTVTCTNGTLATITLGQGSYPAAASTDTVPARQMGSGGNRLAYFLYQDAATTVVWGNTAATGQTQTGTGIAGTPLLVYGAVPAAQNVAAGTYADTVVATVSF